MATQAEIENSHPHITGDLLKTAWATYCCELSSFLPEHLPENELFDLLAITLEALDVAASERSEIIGRWFEAHYLALLGYAPQIGRCMSCDTKIVVAPDDLAQKLIFSPALGGTLCGSCAGKDANRLIVNVQALRALHQLLRAAEPPAGWDLTGTARRDLHDCLRRALAAHLDLRPKSQTFLDEVMADVATQPLL
jgi:DNA repair protein RecO (recombination protein O)